MSSHETSSKRMGQHQMMKGRNPWLVEPNKEALEARTQNVYLE